MRQVIARALLADSARLVALLAGLSFALLVATGAVAPVDLQLRMLAALALTGWALILFGRRAQEALDRWLRGTQYADAPQRVVRELLQASDLAALQQLWVQTLDRLFMPMQRQQHAATTVSFDAQGGDLFLPNIEGPGWVLRQPRRMLSRYDARDAQLAQQLWQLFEPVRDALRAFEQGRRRERERLAERLLLEIELPLRGIAARSDAAPLGLSFEHCIAQVESVRFGLLGEPCALDSLIAEQQSEFSTRLREAGIGCTFEADPTLHRWRLDARCVAHLRSLLREATTNLIRHSGARRARFAVRASDLQGGIQIEIDDDGRGFDASLETTGQGRLNMQRRAAAIDARLRWVQPDSGGTRIELRWKSPEKEAEIAS